MTVGFSVCVFVPSQGCPLIEAYAQTIMAFSLLIVHSVL